MPEALAFAHRLAELPAQPLQDTKRAINLHLTAAAARVLPYALAAEELSFSFPDVGRIAHEFAERAEKKKGRRGRIGGLRCRPRSLRSSASFPPTSSSGAWTTGSPPCQRCCASTSPTRAAASRRSTAFPRRYQNLLYDAGWLRAGWPAEIGGTGGSAERRAQVYESLSAAGYALPETLPTLEVLIPALL